MTSNRKARPNLLHKVVNKIFPLTFRLAGKFHLASPITTSAPAIIINSDGYILLGERKRNHPIYGGYHGLPGGDTEYGEKLKDAVEREVNEEIGAKVYVTRIGKLYEQLPNKECGFHNIMIPHYCDIEKGETISPKDETETLGWFSPEQVRELGPLAYQQHKLLEQERFI